MTTLNPERARPAESNGGSAGGSRRYVALLAVATRAAACPLALLGGCRGVLDPQGPVGAGEKLILLDAVAIMLVIVVPVIVATLAFAWWFRASNARARYLPDWSFSGRIELIIWSIPALVIMFLGGLAWVSSHDLDPAKPLPAGAARPLQVEVVSLDWKWLFIYPDLGIASVNQLVVPAGAPLHLRLTSGSVMTAFFVPQLGSMIYTMNGMVTQLNLQADHPGSYPGLASQFSGDGFAGMHFETRAVAPAAFAAWAADAKSSGPVLDASAYVALSRQSQDVAPFTYRAAPQGLFEQIAMRELPPGPGPLGGGSSPKSEKAP
ncbi:ubiquinol oxidase subunit II [Phenylobacterium sp.]|uniref:ubiquinol oxidase subunit II n=1 Tax=Phenylobacterium sp. TaxID=1871053 RepID=UPI0012072AA6|nr:ubiquinol oxidase subunit II [Phenylobacterium sp.]THD57509.1 MAG: ubiquinol oxidase subunit II [Phenylobacterium sp.]